MIMRQPKAAKSRTAGGVLTGRSWLGRRILAALTLSCGLAAFAAAESVPEHWAKLSSLERVESVATLLCGNSVINDLVRGSVSKRRGFTEDGIAFARYENEHAAVYLPRNGSFSPSPDGRPSG
jgi:hypothetical protein